MILYATPGNSAPVPVAHAAESAVTSGVYTAAVGGPPDEDFSIEGLDGEQAKIEPPPLDRVEDFNWSDPKTNREYIVLEQKVLAKKDNPEEAERYHYMKRDRNSFIFSDRYVRDYAEVQRLKKLAERLAEIQRFLKPFSL